MLQIVPFHQRDALRLPVEFAQLFYSTQIPVCLWFLTRDKKDGRFRDRRGTTLFIDARKLGAMVDRIHRELTDADVERIAGTYHSWRGDRDAGPYADVSGFCASTTLEEIHEHGYVLTPGRYVGVADVVDDALPLHVRLKRLSDTLEEQFRESERLTQLIRQHLDSLSHV